MGSYLLFPVPASGATRTWDGEDPPNTNWNDATNWSPNTAPSSGDTLVFPVGIAAGNKEEGPDPSLYYTLVSGTGFLLGANGSGTMLGVADPGTPDSRLYVEGLLTRPETCSPHNRR